MHKCYFVANPYVRCGAGVDFALVNSACVRIINPRKQLPYYNIRKTKMYNFVQRFMSDPFVLRVHSLMLEKIRHLKK